MSQADRDGVGPISWPVLAKVRDTVQLWFFLLSVFGILAAGEIFLSRRSSQLQQTITSSNIVEREVVLSTIRRLGESPEIVSPPLPPLVLGKKQYFVGSPEVWLKLLPKETSAEQLAFKSFFERADLQPDPALQSKLPEDIQRTLAVNSWLAKFAGYAGTKLGVLKLVETIREVKERAVAHVVIVEVTNHGDGDSDHVEVLLPPAVRVESSDGDWEIKSDRATVRFVRPKETVRLVLVGEKFELPHQHVTLKNRQSLFAQEWILWGVWLITGVFAFAAGVVDWGQAVGRWPAPVRWAATKTRAVLATVRGTGDRGLALVARVRGLLRKKE